MNALAVGVAFAAQQAAPRGPDFGIFIMFGSLFAIFYFLVLRPQQKQRKDLEEAIKTASKGDQVVTAGGLHGRIVSTDEDTFTIEIASLKGQSVRVVVSRAKVESVARAAKPGDAKSDDSTDAPDKASDKKSRFKKLGGGS